MTSKEALNYIKNHGVWRFASIHGWNTPDEKLIESFETIEKDLIEKDELEKLREEIGDILFTSEDIDFLQMVNNCQGLILKYLRQKADRRESNGK